MRILSLADYVEMVGEGKAQQSLSASQAAINQAKRRGNVSVFLDDCGSVIRAESVVPFPDHRMKRQKQKTPTA